MKKTKNIALLLLKLLVAVFILSCASQPQKTTYLKNGKEFGKVSGTLRPDTGTEKVLGKQPALQTQRAAVSRDPVV